MHDNEIEDGLRSVLRKEGDELSVNITALELERRLALRRRARAGQRLRIIAAGMAAVAIGGIVIAGNGWFRTAPAIGGPPASRATDSASPSSSSNASPPGRASSGPSASQADNGLLSCDGIDPSHSSGPPVLVAAAMPGDAVGLIGTTVAFEWNGAITGVSGTWQGLTAEPQPIVIGPAADHLEAVSDGCFAQVSAEALLTAYAQAPTPSPTPVPLRVTGGGTNSRVVDLAPPSVGDWTVRIRVQFVTTDGSPAWSEYLFRVVVPFAPPTLTMTSGGNPRDVSAEAGCPSYRLATGASASGQCAAKYATITDIAPLIVPRGASATTTLSDGWQIDQLKATAVRADLVATGQNAPESSVAFLDVGGPAATFPIVLDPGSWILRVSVSGSKDRDTFGAYYDLPVTVTR